MMPRPRSRATRAYTASIPAVRQLDMLPTPLLSQEVLDVHSRVRPVTLAAARAAAQRERRENDKLCGRENKCDRPDGGAPIVCGGIWGLVLIFFFQAEDGIRDLTVTGVQTCALPI